MDKASIRRRQDSTYAYVPKELGAYHVGSVSYWHSFLLATGWAYHINDDRYDYVRQWEPTPPETHKTVERAPRFSMISSPNLQLAAFSPLPTEFATVALNESGGVYVAWLNPDYENHWVNIGAVMNRGAFCVP